MKQVCCGGAKIFAVWGQREGKAKGLGAIGGSNRASNYLGDIGGSWRQGRGHRGGSCPPPPR